MQASDAQLLLQYGIPPSDASANPFNEAVGQSLLKETLCKAVLVLPRAETAQEQVFHLPREAA